MGHFASSRTSDEYRPSSARELWKMLSATSSRNFSLTQLALEDDEEIDDEVLRLSASADDEGGGGAEQDMTPKNVGAHDGRWHVEMCAPAANPSAIQDIPEWAQKCDTVLPLSRLGVPSYRRSEKVRIIAFLEHNARRCNGK